MLHAKTLRLLCVEMCCFSVENSIVQLHNLKHSTESCYTESISAPTLITIMTMNDCKIRIKNKKETKNFKYIRRKMKNKNTTYNSGSFPLFTCTRDIRNYGLIQFSWNRLLQISFLLILLLVILVGCCCYVFPLYRKHV